MLDIKVIRNNPDAVKQAMRTRNMDADAIIDEILDIDVQRIKITGDVEAKNADTKQIPLLKKEGKDTTALME